MFHVFAPNMRCREFRCCALAAAILTVTLVSTAGAVEAATSQLQGPRANKQFNVPTGDLASALNRFAEQSGLRLIYPAELTTGLITRGLIGNYAPMEGLNQLLRGTGVSARVSGENAVTLERVSVRDSNGVVVTELLTLDPVRVEGKASVSDEDRPYTTAGSSSHISQQQIERFRGTTVGDIFQGTPGVLVGENRNSGGLDVNIRGMQGQSRVPVLLDGARQETTVWRGYAGVSSRTYVDPDLIGGIDITKGPSVTADSTGAVGGLVSMRTLSANDIIKDGESWGLRVRGGAFGNSSAAPPPLTVAGMSGTGRTYRIDCAVPSLCEGDYALPASFGSAEGMNRPDTADLRSWAGSIAAAGRFEHFDLVAAYAQRSQGNYYSGTHGPTPNIEFTYRQLPFYTEVTAIRDGITRFRGGERVVNSNNDSNSILLKSTFYPTDAQSWEFGFVRYKSEYGELMPSQLIWLDRVKQTDNSTVNAQTWTSRYEWNPSDRDWLHLRFNAWHTHTNSVNRSYSEDIYEGIYSRDPTPEYYDRWGSDLGNEMRFEKWGAHTLTYGVTAQWENINTQIPLDEDGHPLDNAGYGRIGDRQEFSLFLDWRWKPWKTLTFDAGLRYSKARTDDHKLVIPKGHDEFLYDDDGHVIDTVYVQSVFCVDKNGDGACDPIRYRTNNDGAAPAFSLTYEPWGNGLQFYAQYMQALRLPSLFETTQGWSVVPALDVPLRPEHAYNYELGANLLRRDALFVGDRLTVKLAAFYNLTRNYLTRTSPNEWEEGGQIFVMRNIQSVDLHGFELSTGYDAGPVYGELGGTYYNHIEVCHYGSYRRDRCNNYGVANSYFNNMIPPKWHASATLGARFFAKRLDVGARGTFMGLRTPTPPFNDDVARGFNRAVPWRAYNLLDLYASWKQNDTVTVDFNIDNVTDRYYLDALSLGLVPAPGRTARLSLTVNF
ncbi:MAG: TonB-dependent receptor [Pseudomonadota bacterium]